VKRVTQGSSDAGTDHIEDPEGESCLARASRWSDRRLPGGQRLESCCGLAVRAHDVGDAGGELAGGWLVAGGGVGSMVVVVDEPCG
jgi:hypothetical protein